MTTNHVDAGSESKRDINEAILQAVASMKQAEYSTITDQTEDHIYESVEDVNISVSHSAPNVEETITSVVTTSEVKVTPDLEVNNIETTVDTQTIQDIQPVSQEVVVNHMQNGETHSDVYNSGIQNGDESSELQVATGFTDAGRAQGLEVWRIEQFEPVKQTQKTFGKFYSGDSYIVLYTYKNPDSKFLSWNLHFWIGANSSQDESGSAAYRAVELDEYLGGQPVQYREVQAHESRLFLSYFKKGIRYLSGGAQSGFKHVDRYKYTKRLFRVSGGRNVRIEEVPVVSSSLNQSEVFILDDLLHMYVWVGPKSPKMLKIVGVQTCRAIRDDEKAGRSQIHIIEDDWENNRAFFKTLGSHEKHIRASPDENLQEVDRKSNETIALYRLTDRGGSVDLEEIGQRPLSMALLKSDECLVLDSGIRGIYVWTGRKSNMEFKKRVWGMVEEFLNERGYPSWVNVTRVIEGGETPLFKQYFDDWVDLYETQGEGITYSQSQGVAESSYEEFDASKMHVKVPTTQEIMPDDGTGDIKVWRVDRGHLKAVPKDAYGFFFGGDSYVIQYAYQDGGRLKHIIYFWQGLKSGVDSQTASALHALQLDDNLGGEAVQVRVVMNKEPEHFLKIFNGRVVIFMEGHIIGFRNVHDHDTYDPRATVMFHIRGTSEINTRAIQVPARGASLNSNDVFIVEHPRSEKTFVWVGKYANEHEVNMADYCVNYCAPGSKEAIVIEEGRENHTFWGALGGEEPYHTGPKKENAVKIPPRLFHCSNASGRFLVEEIANFTQEDLVEDDVIILDTYDELFVWIGKGANEFEKTESLKTSYDYLNTDPSGRTPENTLIIVLRQGFEPPQFTGHFHPWDSDKWNKGKTFEEIIKEVGEENAGISLLEEEAKKYETKYPIEVLQRRLPPEGVDVTAKERYLSDEEFMEVFGMSQMDFQRLPEWRQIIMKKEVGLF